MGGEWTKHSLLLASATAGWLAFAVATEATPLDELVAAAKAEGQLNVIGLPHDWCGYGAIIDGFKTRFGIPVIELSPDIGSTKVIDEIRNARAVSAAPAPDVIDVGHPFASSAKKEGLLQPYKVRTWATIPDAAKDADGYWAGAYYGTIAIEVNTDIIRILPTNWADLQKPAYKGAVGLAGDLGSNQAIQSIFAAGLSAAGGNHETAAELGLTFFATLHEKGNFVSLVGNLATLVDGRTPILIRWDYLAIADRERLKDKSRIEIIRPKTGVVAGFMRRRSALSPHIRMPPVCGSSTCTRMKPSSCSPTAIAIQFVQGKWSAVAGCPNCRCLRHNPEVQAPRPIHSFQRLKSRNGRGMSSSTVGAASSG